MRPKPFLASDMDSSARTIAGTTAYQAPLPPGPRGLPLVGSAPFLLRDPIGFMESCVERYGRIHSLRLGPIRATILHDADAIDHVLVRSGKNYPKSTLGQRATAPLLGEGMATIVDREAWKSSRHAIRPVFLGRLLADYTPHMVRSIARDADALLTEGGDGGTVDVYKRVHEMVFRILVGTIFARGIDDGEVEWLAIRFDEMKGYVNARFLTLGALDWLPLPEILRGKRAMRELDAWVYRLIERRRREGVPTEGGDVLDILLAATDLQGRPLAEKSIRDECMTLLFGGHETTAGSLTWTFALLAKNPDKREKLMAEVDEVLGGRAPAYAEVDRLAYTRMAFEEAMRFYPMWLVLFRDAAEEDVIGGYRVPKGSLVAFCGYTTHRDPRWWPEPERYEPERHTKEASAGRPRSAWLPFSMGERACIAARMATHQAVLVLAICSQRWTLDLVEELPPPEVRMSIRPKGASLRMRISKRGR